MVKVLQTNSGVRCRPLLERSYWWPTFETACFKGTCR